MRVASLRWMPVLLVLAAFTVLRGLAPTAGADDDFTTMRSVVDRPIEEARTTLTAEGLLVATVDVAGAPAGTVASQQPAADARIPRGSVVILEVRVASEVAPAPKVVGLSAAEASNAFGSLYVLRFVAGSPTPTQPGLVVAQDPAMGAPLALHGVLTLTLARDPSKPATAVVPDASGLSPADAAQALAASGLFPRLAHVALPGTPADLVIGQMPLPGTEVPVGTAVDVVVTAEPPAGSGGAPALVPVPNLVGLSESSARAALEEARLNAKIEWVDGAPEQAFLVVSQEPAAEESLAVGAEVLLRLVRYATPQPVTPLPSTQVSMPSLLGMSQAQAEDLLASLDLVPNPSFLANASVPPLRVFAQQLSPGSLVPVGTQVAFRVSMPPPPPTSVPVPQLYGKSKGQALSLAALAGFSLNVVDVVTNAYQPHRVFTQSIAPYSLVPVGTLLTVKIARPPSGPAQAVVPDLSNRTKFQALSALATAGLASDPVEVLTLAHTPYRVFAQVPAAGLTVPAGTVIHFQLAKPPPNAVTVPPVVGLGKGQAIALVSNAGLVPQTLELVAPGKPVGQVYEQFPIAGTQRLPGSVVQLKVAKAITVPVPPLFGLTIGQATAALGGSLVGNALIVDAPLKPPGKVFAQSPAAGALVAPGSVVTYQVAKLAGPVVVVGVYVGLPRAQAVLAVQQAGLVPDVVEVSRVIGPYGIVVEQSPGVGPPVPQGTHVVLKVYVPVPPAVQVPNLIWLTPLQAKQALENRGLVSNGIKAPWPLKPPGRVYAQSATVNSYVAPGTTISWRWNP